MLLASWRKVTIEQVFNGYIVSFGADSHDDRKVYSELDDAIAAIKEHYNPR